MFLTIYTLFHVLLSLVGIASGLVVVGGLLQRKRLDGWTAIFLTTTVATSLTGFGFPFINFLPSHVVGILSLLVLVPTIAARYRAHLAGRWRWIYVVGAVIALYFNVFVLVVQSFLKIPALRAIAPTQTELPFALTQLTVLGLFIFLGVVAVMRFRIDAGRARQESVEVKRAKAAGSRG